MATAEEPADILAIAKGIQRKAAIDQKCWVTLAFIEDMIAEIERLRRRLAKTQKPATVVDIKKRAEAREERP